MSFLEKLDKEIIQDDIQKILNDNEVVQDINKKIIGIWIAICVALLGMLTFYVSAKKIKVPDVIFVSEKNEVLTLKPMSLPIQSKHAVRKWTANAVRKMYTFNFLDYANQLQSSKVFFTADGWEAFKSAFNASDLKKKMEENQLEVAVTLKEEPYLEGGLKSVAFDKKTGEEFAWKLLVPIQLAFTGNGKSVFDQKILEITVVRVPTVDNPYGLGIVKVIPREYTVKE